MNLTERLIQAGFKPDNGSKTRFNPKDNLIGASVYHPDCFFDKGNRTVHLSVQGGAMPLPELTEENLSMLKSRGARYIGFKVDNKWTYQNWRGVLPSEDFINDFLK